MGVLNYLKEIFLGEEEDLSDEEMNSEKFGFSEFISAAILIAALTFNIIGVILIFG